MSMQQRSLLHFYAEQCLECFTSCTETIQHCLLVGGKHVDRPHLNLLETCADLCRLTARSLLMGFERHMDFCALCADICEACAKSCEAIGDEHMKACAAECRECAISCREAANQLPSGQKAA